MKDFFVNEKPVRTLITLRSEREDIYCSMISTEIDTTYAHTVRIISRLEDEGLISTEKKGRKKFIHLTDKGEDYAEEFQLLLDLFDEDESQDSINSPETKGLEKETL